MFNGGEFAEVNIGCPPVCDGFSIFVAFDFPLGNAIFCCLALIASVLLVVAKGRLNLEPWKEIFDFERSGKLAVEEEETVLATIDCAVLFGIDEC